MSEIEALKYETRSTGALGTVFITRHSLCLSHGIYCVYHTAFTVFITRHLLCLSHDIYCVYHTTFTVFITRHLLCLSHDIYCVYHTTFTVFITRHLLCLSHDIYCVYHTTFTVPECAIPRTLESDSSLTFFLKKETNTPNSTNEQCNIWKVLLVFHNP